MAESAGNVDEQQGVDGLLIENLVDIGALTVQLTGKPLDSV